MTQRTSQRTHQRTRHLRRGIGGALAALVVAGLPAVASADGTTGGGPVFFTPTDASTVRLADTARSVHVLLGAGPEVVSVALSYRRRDSDPWTPVGGRLTRPSAVAAFDTTWTSAPTGSLQLQATGYGSVSGTDVVGTPTVERVEVSAEKGTDFEFVRPAAGEPLGVFRRADGHAFVRTSGITSSSVEPSVDAPTVTGATPPPTSLPTPGGAFTLGKAGWTWRKPIDLTGNPGLASGRAVVRVADGTSTAAVETPLYTQTVAAVRYTATPVAGGASVLLTAKVTDQDGQPVVGAVVRLGGFAYGSAPVSQLAVSDAYDGLARFTAPVPASGFYTAYADLNLDGVQGPREPAFAAASGTLAKAAPGKAFFHSDTRIKTAGGVLSDSLRGTKIAAARGYTWIDQDGQLSYSAPANLRGGVGRVSQAAHLTWVNAHGAPYNPKWLGKGRFETRAWSSLRRRPGLRNADMTFQQNAARGISVEWEVKNIRPFTTPAALNAAFANLAASAQRYYGAAWRSRVQVKMLSDHTGGQPFALKVLRVAHAHGFTTILLARGAAVRTPIPAAAHQYVTYVRGARAGLYPSTGTPAIPR